MFKGLNTSHFTEDDLLGNAQSVYPEDWLPCMHGKHHVWDPADRNCTIDSTLPISTVDYHAKLIGIRLRYLQLHGFTYRSGSFFLLSNEDVRTNHIAYVLKPMTQGRFDVSCTLEMILPEPQI